MPAGKLMRSMDGSRSAMFACLRCVPLALLYALVNHGLDQQRIKADQENHVADLSEYGPYTLDEAPPT